MINQQDLLQIVSFVVGLANYQENLTQNDKADLMDKLDRQTKEILLEVQNAIEEQNKMLKAILEMLERLDNGQRKF